MDISPNDLSDEFVDVAVRAAGRVGGGGRFQGAGVSSGAVVRSGSREIEGDVDRDGPGERLPGAAHRGDGGVADVAAPGRNLLR